jgi:hypothetical protein
MTRSRFLDFGGYLAPHELATESTLDFLTSQGFGNGALAQSRQALSEQRHKHFAFDSFGVGHCDFCFIELMGGAYDALQDGRRRCTRCSRSVLSAEDAFRDEFELVRRNMEMAFGISVTTPLAVRMVNANEIASRTGESFTPTPAVNPRVLGFVEARDGALSLYIENGSPRIAAVTTMAHELTHVWQISNWDMPAIEARYGKQNTSAVVEGMAVWAQIQYLLITREFSYAERQFVYSLARNDEYGVGFRVFAQRYPLSEDGQPQAASPFRGQWPL